MNLSTLDDNQLLKRQSWMSQYLLHIRLDKQAIPYPFHRDNFANIYSYCISSGVFMR